MNVLFLALSSKGMGETILGVRLAEQAHAQGHRCAFLTHECSTEIVTSAGFPHTLVPMHAERLLPLFLMSAMGAYAPDVIVLSDYFTTATAFDRAGMTFDDVARYERPIGAIDTWDVARTGLGIDLYGEVDYPIANWVDKLAFILQPVPTVALEGANAQYSALPKPTPLTRKIRRHVRFGAGVGADDRMVVISTAEWQAVRGTGVEARPTARAVPRMIGRSIDALGERVHVVHIGPETLDLGIGDRYHWMPPLPSDSFRVVVAAADALVTLNISATTNAAALVDDVPVVCVRNSRRCPWSEVGVSENDPRGLYPFELWPLGFHSFLGPMLDANPLCAAIDRIELLDAAGVSETLSSLLFDGSAHDTAIARQRRYVDAVGALPASEQVFASSLASVV